MLPQIPDEVVIRKPKPTREGRRGPSPPPSPDVLGPVLRVIIIVAAAMTGLRMSELRGLRWCDVDWTAQRLRVRNTYVRSEHDSDGKSELSTKRSVPMTTLLAGILDRWSQRSAFMHTHRPVNRWSAPRRSSASRKPARTRRCP